MEADLQELRDLVAQLKADNERLQQEQAAAVPGPSTVPSNSSVPPTASHTASNPIAERLGQKVFNVQGKVRYRKFEHA